MKPKKNGRIEKTINWILRIIVDINAFNEQTVDEKFKNIEYQAQQFEKKKKKECVHGEQGGGDGDVVPQKLYVEWQRENHPLVFTTKSEGIGSVLFVIGVAGDGKVKSNKKKGRICKIMVDVASRK